MSQSSHQEYPNCELCDCTMDEDSYGGSCCSQCPRHVEHMCSDCSAWNEDETQLLCPECKQAEAQPEPEQAEPAQPDPATRIMTELSIDHYSDMYGDSLECSPDSIQEYWANMGQDFADCYDTEWYGLIMVPNVEKTIDWAYICDRVCEKCPQWTRA